MVTGRYEGGVAWECQVSVAEQPPTAAQVRDELPERGDDVAAAVAELSGLLLTSEGLEQVLQRVAELAVRTVPGCTGAGVTLLTDGRPVTAAHTDELVLKVDSRQYDVGEGPCLDAARSLRRNLVDVDEASEQWPDFLDAARELGVHSFLAAPLVADGQGLGSMNLYSTSPDGFGALDVALVDLFCAQASVALANARAYRAAEELGAQLQQAMASRAVIEQAKGALMVTRGLTEDEAFASLRETSQRSNRKLRDVAEAVVRRRA